MRTSDQLLAELKGLHPRRIDLSLGRIERLWKSLAIRKSACRRSSMLPVRTARGH